MEGYSATLKDSLVRIYSNKTPSAMLEKILIIQINSIVQKKVGTQIFYKFINADKLQTILGKKLCSDYCSPQF